MKKKIMSLLIAIAMLPGIGTLALANGENEGLIFDMDLSEYNDTDGVVKNAVTGTDEGIEIQAATNGTRPRMGEMDSISGTTKYLIFSGLRGKTVFYNYGSLNLSKELCEPLQNQDAMSVEFWVNYLTAESGATKSSRIFNFGPQSGATDSNNSYEIYVNDSLNQYFVRYARLNMNPSQYLERRINVVGNMNKWTHYVLTREWDEAKQQYTGNVYVNGESQGEITGGIRIDETDFRVQIGNMAGRDVLNGSLAEFKLYTTALSAESVLEKYNDSKIGFMQMSESMNLVSPTEGKTLDTSPGEIEIEFDNYVDVDTIDGITFMKKDGTQIVGGVDVYTKEELTKYVYVKYGRLDSDSEYVLDIPDTVTSKNGFSCGGHQIEFKTEGFYILYEDFEEYEVGGKPDGEKLLYTSSEVAGSLENVVIKEATGTTASRKKKYVSLVTDAEDGKASNSMAAVVFDTPVTYDFVVEVGVRGQNGSAAARTSRIYGTAGGFSIVGNFLSGSSIRSDETMGADKDKLSSLYKTYNTGATDEFGFMRMKYIFQKDTDGKYIVTGTCLDDENVDYRMPIIHHDCTQFVAVQQYNAPNRDLCVDLSYVKVYRYNVPEIIGDNTAELTQNSDEISLNFSEDINPDTVTDNCAKLVNVTTGRTVLTKVSGYDESERKLSVKLGEYLDYGNEYDLYITDIRTTDDVPVREGEKVSFTFHDYALKLDNLSVQNQDGNSIESLEGASGVTVSVDIKNIETTDKDAKLFAVLYDKNNVYQAADMEIVTVSPDNTETVSVTLSEIEPKEGDYLKIYVWDKTDNAQIVVMQEPVNVNY